MCAITACDAADALEAAHIVPYCGEQSNHAANGLLLRADLHTLFDLDLIGIEPHTLKVSLVPDLRRLTYAEFHGKILAAPSDPADRPSKNALAERWRKFLRLGIPTSKSAVTSSFQTCTPPSTINLGP
jgi:hypothetical protein